MKNKVIFFQPKTDASSNYINNDGNEQIWTPWFAPILSPAALANGFDVELVDARVDFIDWEVKLSTLKIGDILAISVMTGHAIKGAINASLIAHEKQALVIWGGTHPTLFPKQTLAEAPLDFCIIGAGYYPFFNLIHSIRFNNPTDNINGVLMKNESHNFASFPKYSNNITRRNYNLDIVSNWEPYINSDNAISDHTVNFITSEGCPRHCTFCSEPITSNRNWNIGDINGCVDDCIKMLKLSGAKGVKLHDPNFFHETNRASIFAEKLSKFDNVPWAASAHPDDIINMPADVLQSFSKRGLRRLLIGLESPVKSIVKLSGKMYDPDHIPLLAIKLKQANIKAMFTYIVGWPNFDTSHYYETIDSAFLIKSIWDEHQCKIHFLEPWPGTPIYKLISKQLDLAFPKSLLEWSDINYYQAQYSELHSKSMEKTIQNANKELSPYVTA